MLQTVEVLPGDRDALRREVRVEANLIAQGWAEPRKHRVLDLSEDGMCVASGTRLGRDQFVVVSFTPPGWWVLDELTLFARVCRSTPRREPRPAMMGLEFLDLARGAREQLRLAVQGMPPPLRRYRKQTEMVWVDELVTWEEDLGDRVNTFEVSGSLMPIFDGMITPRAIGPRLG